MWRKKENMEKEKIEIFKNEEFGEVRVVMIDSEPYFVAKDIATVLGYKDPKNTVKNRCKKGRVSEIPHPQNSEKTLNITVIPESDVYRLIIGSKLKSAQKFEAWVMEEVLPTIRKHGAYMSNEVIERTLTDPDYLIQLAMALKKEREEKQKMEQKMEADKPYTELGKKISETDDTIDIGEFAKILNDKESIDIGRNRLFSWLRDNKYIMQNNVPYQKYINNNYFDLTEVAKGNKLFPKTLITGKGQVAILRKLQREFA